MADTETPTPAAEISVAEHIEQRAAEADAKKYEDAFAAEAEAAPAPEAAVSADAPQAESKPESKAEDEPTKQVSEGLKKLEERMAQKTAALHQEREARRQLEQKLAALSPKPAADIPDPTTDPIGYLEYDRRQKLEAAKADAERGQLEAQQRQVQEIVSRTQEYEADFAAATPDYYDATHFLRDSRAREYQALGLSEADAKARVDVEALQTAADMLSRGVDPAKGWYDLAKTRGFAGKAADAAPAPSMIDTIREGQKAAQTLSSGGGKPSGDLSAGAIADLKGAAFDQAIAQLRDRELAAEKRARFT